MKIAIYPGSFNPWHSGHEDVLKKAKMAFDKVIVVQLSNPDKSVPFCLLPETLTANGDGICYRGKTLKEVANELQANAIIKGLRNAQDLEYETVQQYWNEDLGITIPTFYVITDRNLRHISSSAIRAVEKFK